MAEEQQHPIVSPSAARSARRRRAERLAATQEGVVTRPQLYALGLTRAEVRANVRAQRWRCVGRQCVCMHRGPLGQRARHWVAVLEAGPRAHLDGASALLEEGLQHFSATSIRVSVPRGARVYRRLRDVDIRQTRRWCVDDIVGDGVPRARPGVAAVRAALWARTDREAALLMTMTVQQGLATAAEVAEALLRVRRDRRRVHLHAVLVDLLGGVRSLGELDVARECRRRGLPEPTRQVLRKTKSGRYYLDVYWERWRLVLEVDGIQHAWAEQVVGDALRQNTLVLRGDTVLRLPLLGLRVDADAFFDQIEEALVAAGWQREGGARRTA